MFIFSFFNLVLLVRYVNGSSLRMTRIRHFTKFGGGVIIWGYRVLFLLEVSLGQFLNGIINVFFLLFYIISMMVLLMFPSCFGSFKARRKRRTQLEPRSKFEPLRRDYILRYVSCTIRFKYKGSVISFFTIFSLINP